MTKNATYRKPEFLPPSKIDYNMKLTSPNITAVYYLQRIIVILTKDNNKK
jgi:hypothetical protein